VLYPCPNEKLKKVAIVATYKYRFSMTKLKNVFGDEVHYTKLVLHIEARFTTGIPGSQQTRASTNDGKKICAGLFIVTGDKRITNVITPNNHLRFHATSNAVHFFFLAVKTELVVWLSKSWYVSTITKPQRTTFDVVTIKSHTSLKAM